MARRPTGQIVMGVLYVAAGALHFVLTEDYVRMMPSALPAHRTLVLVSGVAEMAGGLGLLVPEGRNEQPRRAAAWGIMLLLVMVFPANLTPILEHARFPKVPLWAAVARLPLQLPLLWWAWRYTRRRDGVAAG